MTSGYGKAVITRSPGIAGNFMRIGLVGVGRIGVFHASTLRGLPGVDSLSITDADLDRALSRHRQQPVLVAEVRQ
jgi:predicted dehydrogenase